MGFRRWDPRKFSFRRIVLGLVTSAKRYSPPTRYFLVLAMAGNLFTATGYFLFSGVMNFGDWAAVTKGLEPFWAWRLGSFWSWGRVLLCIHAVVAAALRPSSVTTKAACAFFVGCRI